MCSICNGYPDCPVCSEEVSSCDCDECDGHGEIYMTEDKGKVSYSEYLNTSDCEKDTEICSKCDGAGIIEFAY